jgi:hypothetical protein
MTSSSKIEADYVELINEALDQISIDSVADFAVVQCALQHISTPHSNYEIPTQYQERINAIREYLESPELYVQNKEDYAEFKELIKARIVSKISELESMDQNQKLSYIDAQAKRKSATTENQKIMSKSKAPKPGDAAHVLSEEERHIEIQSSRREHQAYGRQARSSTPGTLFFAEPRPQQADSDDHLQAASLLNRVQAGIEQAVAFGRGLFFA